MFGLHEHTVGAILPGVVTGSSDESPQSSPLSLTYHRLMHFPLQHSNWSAEHCDTTAAPHHPNRQTPDAQAGDDAQDSPSESKQAVPEEPELAPPNVYPSVHVLHSPVSSQLVHSSSWQLAPAHFPFLQTPDRQREGEDEQELPSEIFGMHLFK